MRNIIVEAKDAWKHFEENKKLLKDRILALAENPEFGVVIYMGEEFGLPAFTVMVDDRQYDEADAINEGDCTETVNKLYDKYLSGKFRDELIDNEEELEAEMEERETELSDAAYEFMSVVADYDGNALNNEEFDAIIEDVKEHMLEYIARKHGFKIRRPMILEDEDGNDCYSEYPYEEMEFDDEDNPIYKKEQTSDVKAS